MLVSLRVSNFKSIREQNVRFGPLTCVVGQNGVGKSNLFDAIHFLSLLAERSVYDASVQVRRSTDPSHSPLDLIYRRDPRKRIRLSADMIVPTEVVDDFGLAAQPSTTLLTYTVELRYDTDSDRLLVDAESLTHAKLGDFQRFTAFPSKKDFRHSVAIGARRGGPLISTENGRIELHGDGGSRGRPAPAGTSPLTVVGGTNTVDYPTVLAAKREMASWRLLHLEPTAMRSSDPRAAVPHVDSNGGRLAATLANLVKKDPRHRFHVVNRLRELNSDVEDIEAFHDHVRDQLVLRAKLGAVNDWLYARSLSDGTLRYIALALMLVDTEDGGVLCLEEPENGIHPSRTPVLVDLLYDYAVDPDISVDGDNPLRQVIINTHSPEVARRIAPDDLIFSERAVSSDGSGVSVFRPMVNSWRSRAGGVAPAKPMAAVSEFIGGAPMRSEYQQMEFEFGSAS